MNKENTKIPTSWKIWVAIWVLPIFLAIGIYSNDPLTAISMFVTAVVLIVLMLVRPKCVLPWFCVIFLFDLIGYGVNIGREGTMITPLTGAVIKELVFLGYLLFSNNAKRHQGRLMQPLKIEKTET